MGEYEQTRRDASTCCCKDHPYNVTATGDCVLVLSFFLLLVSFWERALRQAAQGQHTQDLPHAVSRCQPLEQPSQLHQAIIVSICA